MNGVSVEMKTADQLLAEARLMAETVFNLICFLQQEYGFGNYVPELLDILVKMLERIEQIKGENPGTE